MAKRNVLEREWKKFDFLAPFTSQSLAGNGNGDKSTRLGLPTRRLSFATSEDTVLGAWDDILRNYASLSYKLPFELLDYVELLALFNPDYSQAVENIKTLGNP